MTLSELLSTLRADYLRDTGRPYLWSDATLVNRIDDAQRRFARQTLCLRDNSTPEVTQVTLVAGQSEYILHEAVIGVISARYDTSISDLYQAGHKELATGFYINSWFNSPSSVSNAPGEPLAWSIDEGLANEDRGRMTLRIYPVPDSNAAGKIVYLRTIRMPLTNLSMDNLTSGVPEIPEDYHLDLLDWAAYRALRTLDGDAGGSVAGDRFRQRFEEAVVECRNEVKRKLFAPAKWAYGSSGMRYW